MPENVKKHEWQLETQSDVVDEPTETDGGYFEISVPVLVTVFLRCKNCRAGRDIKTLLKSKEDRERELDGPCVNTGGDPMPNWR